MRGLEPGRELLLRDDDLEVLAEALERNIREIEGRLCELMLPGAASPWFSRLRHRLAVPAAGILVGLTTVGTLVLVQFPDGSRPEVQPLLGAAGPSQDTSEAVLASSVSIGDAELAPPIAIVRGTVTGAAASYVPGDPVSTGVAGESLITYDFRAVLDGWTIQYGGPREGYRGNTNTVTRTINVYVSADDTPTGVADVIAHEVGHAADVMYLDDGQRNSWLEQRGITEGWWPHSGAWDFHVGAGDFAEAVAAVIVASVSDSKYGAFSDADLARVEEMLPSLR
jgi:hypothetical protein